jgi:hypothetical protein
LQDAPMNHAKTGPDVSRADFLFCRVSAQWGWSAEDIAAKLMELSSKAQEEGDRYAERTAKKASLSIGR